MPHMDRREFCRRAAKGIAGIAAGAAAIGLPGTARGFPANEKLIMGAIGIGGRCSTLIDGFLERSDIEFACLCDIDPRRGNGEVAAIEKRRGKRPRKVPDMRALLDDKAIEAVIVATPDHWHSLAAVRACQAGKHVYVEKPPSQNVWEGRKMVEAARKYERAVQVGTQNRSAPYARKALEYIRSGKLGKIHLVKVFNLKPGGPWKAPPDSPQPEGLDYDAWLGPAPKRPFNAGHFHGTWHRWYLYSGGDMADDGIHQLDIARWLIGKDWPKAVHASGGKLAYPVSDGDVPDTQVVTYEYDDLLMTFELTQWTPYMDKIAGDYRMGAGSPYWPQCATRIEVYGTEGLMFFGRHGGSWQVFAKAKQMSRPGVLVAEERGRFPDPEHKADFVEAIRTGRLPSADIEEGHRSAVLVHLANIATRLGGRRFLFDGKTESIPGDPEAAKLLKREYRSPYVIPDVV